MKIKASFDDGTVEDVRVAELMRKYKIDTTFYFCAKPDYANEAHGRTSLSPEQAQAIAKDFEIGSHTISHPLLTRIDLKDALVEIEDSKLMLEGIFKQDINSFCYPRGYANPELQMAVMDAGYTNARSTLVGYVHQSENPYFEQTAVHVACDRKEYGGLDWFNFAINMLELARRTPDSIFHFWGHSWEIEKNNAWHDLERLLKELA